MEQQKVQWGMIFAILFSAITSFVVANFYHQPLHWFLFILIVLTGFFIHTVIIIVKTPEEQA